MCTLSTRLNPFGLEKWEKNRLFLEGIFLPCPWFLCIYNIVLNWNHCIWHAWSFQSIPIIKIWSSIPKKVLIPSGWHWGVSPALCHSSLCQHAKCYLYPSQVLAGEEIQQAGICRQTSQEPWCSHSHVVCPEIATMSLTQMSWHSQNQPSVMLIQIFLPFPLGKILLFCKN